MPSDNTSTIVNQMFKEYRLEGLSMPYTMKDFHKDVVRECLEEATPEELRALLARLTPQQRLDGLPRQQIKTYLERSRKGSSPSRKKKPKPKH